MISKRYMVVGPEGKQDLKKPGLYSSMYVLFYFLFHLLCGLTGTYRAFKPGGYSAPPLPLLIQCPDYALAQLIYDRLQPFFSNRANWTSVPHTMVMKFTTTKEFREAANLVESRRELIWAVKYGSKAGLFLDTSVILLLLEISTYVSTFINSVEALASVDNAKRTDRGEIYQEAFAFRSFTEAVKCQMLNDPSITHLHVYNPAMEPKKSAALRRTLLEETIKDETPEEGLGNPEPASDPESPQLPSREIPSMPSTPHRQGPPSDSQAKMGWGNILFAPNIDVRVHSPGILFFLTWLAASDYAARPSFKPRSSISYPGSACSTW